MATNTNEYNVYNCDSIAVVTSHGMRRINGRNELHVHYYFKHDVSKSYDMPVKEFEKITF